MQAHLSKPLLSKPLHIRLILCRNYQPYGVFCSLNIGVSGLVNDAASVEFLRNNNKIGDILTLIVNENFDFGQDSNNRRNVISLRVPFQRPENSFHSNLITCLGGSTT